MHLAKDERSGKSSGRTTACGDRMRKPGNLLQNHWVERPMNGAGFPARPESRIRPPESANLRRCRRAVRNKGRTCRGAGQASPLAGLAAAYPGEIGMSRRTGRASGSGGEAHQLAGRQRQHPEHQAARRLRMPPDARVAGAELVLEAGAGPLGPRADPAADALGHGEAARAQRPGLPLRVLLEFRIPPRVGVDDRDAAEALARLADLLRAAVRVHEIAGTSRASGTHRRKGDRRPAVADRRRGQDGARRRTAAGRVEVRPAADPARREAPGVPLRAVVAAARQVAGHLLEAHAARPALEAAGLLLHALALAGTPAPVLRLLPGRRLRLRLLPPLDRGRVPRDMADQFTARGLLHQGLVHARRKAGLGEPGERSREGRPARDRADARPAAESAERRVDPEPVDQVPGRRKVPHRLGDEPAAPGTRPRSSGAQPNSFARGSENSNS